MTICVKYILEKCLDISSEKCYNGIKGSDFLNRLIKKTFENRGILCPEDYMSDINKSDYDDLKDIDLLCQYLYEAYSENKHIVILPDFDMDGIMSGVIGFAGLSTLNFHVSLFIPNPADGYEFTEDTIKRLLSEYPDADIILTCDVGTSCINGINYAVSQGVDVIVTDHHTQTYENAKFTKAKLVVNPMRCDESYTHPQICGAYVLYQCLKKYVDTYCSVFECEQINRLRVFAGIGTVSDSMPILYENRQLVKDAINICRLFFTGGADFVVQSIKGSLAYCRAFYGLLMTVNMFFDMGVISSPDDISESFFGYYLAPMFNAVKRLNGDMSRVFSVFFGSNPKEDINYLYDLNERRKLIVKSELKNILDSNQPFAPFIYISNATPGVLGLLATKLMSENNMPTVVVSNQGDSYKGSGRSPAWYSFLSRATSQGFFAAGHECSFGIKINDIDEMRDLYDYLRQDVSDVLDNLPKDVALGHKCDFVIALDDTGDTGIDLLLFAEYLQELERYRPFGVGFSEPVIELRFRMNECQYTLIGSMKQHLKIILPYGFEVLCFNQAVYLDDIQPDDMVVLRGHLSINDYRGKYTINFIGNFEKKRA